VASKTEREPQGGEPLLKRRCGESNKRNLLLSPHLFSQSLTAQALFALKIRRAINASFIARLHFAIMVWKIIDD